MNELEDAIEKLSIASKNSSTFEFLKPMTEAEIKMKNWIDSNEKNWNRSQNSSAIFNLKQRCSSFANGVTKIFRKPNSESTPNASSEKQASGKNVTSVTEISTLTCTNSPRDFEAISKLVNECLQKVDSSILFASIFSDFFTRSTKPNLLVKVGSTREGFSQR